MPLKFDRLKNLDLNSINRTAPIALFLLILYLCWKLAALFWIVVAPLQAMQFERVELGSQQSQVPNIHSFSLFQEQTQNQATADIADLTLQGVMISNPSRLSSAVIKVKEISDRFRVGERLGDTGYELSEVYWDHVIIRQPSGAMQKLNFKGLENGLNQPYPIKDQPSSQPSSASNQAPQTEQPNSPQEEIGRAIQQMNENREQYMQNMGVSSSENGYEVSARTPAILRNRLGLRPGDRILSLNGKTMGNGQSETQLLEQARRDGQVKLEIKRGDQVMTIQQDLK
ncbi:general secretion pathway protein [Acinetobacter wanghuae]|uniref:General secretion pathway protein n=1 Tax=Acinetobacter wanghuae TaxID=2662362 RepID=A0A5Q0NZ31_9GAMM|nr:type II secretion system protein N [Acinetobacter wanghuae]MQW93278.1 general secretion pathway protein [Acinetobacter wanghuae]QGA10105.1 general secretion pathway protein [Acinetobacter wanghuae]